MKRSSVAWILAGLLVFLGASAAHAGAKLKINDKAEIDLGFRLQTIYLSTDRDLDGDGNFETVDDFRIRRGRFRLKGTVNEHFGMFFQTDVSGNDIIMIDAYIHLKKDASFQAFVGQHLAPSGRQNLTSSGTLLAFDRPGMIYKSLTWGARALTGADTATFTDADSGIRGTAQVRDTGVTLFGAIDSGDKTHFKYYVGTYDGISAPGTDSERYTGRLELNFGDAEAGYYHSANHLGKKNTIGVGFSYDTQSDVASARTPQTDYTFYTLDVYAAKPAGGGAFTFEGAWLDLDLDGANPAAEGDGFYTQFGFLMPNDKWQIWGLFEDWTSEAVTGKGGYDLWRVGLSYFMQGHNANFKAGFESANADTLIGSTTEDTINTFALGFFTNF